MKNWILLIICLFVFIFAVSIGTIDSYSEDFTTLPPIPDVSTNAEEITQTSQPYSKYIVYHLGAEWCPPCKRMIGSVWRDQQVISTLKQHDTKLWILDADNPKHKKYFRYYKVRSYPTIMIFDRRNLTKPIYRGSYMTKDGFLKVIRAYL